MAKAKKQETEEPLEKKLWKAADKLRRIWMPQNISMSCWV